MTPDYFSIKVPVFPFDRLATQELGPEMRSTGETMFIQKKITDRPNIKNFDLCSLQELISND